MIPESLLLVLVLFAATLWSAYALDITTTAVLGVVTVAAIATILWGGNP